MAEFSDYQTSETAVGSRSQCIPNARKGWPEAGQCTVLGIVFYVLCFVLVEEIIKNEHLNEDLIFLTEKERRGSGKAAVIYFRGMVKECILGRRFCKDQNSPEKVVI